MSFIFFLPVFLSFFQLCLSLFDFLYLNFIQYTIKKSINDMLLLFTMNMIIDLNSTMNQSLCIYHRSIELKNFKIYILGFPFSNPWLILYCVTFIKCNIRNKQLQLKILIRKLIFSRLYVKLFCYQCFIQIKWVLLTYFQVNF